MTADDMTRPTFTVSAAAAATGLSRRTLGRMLDAGELNGATRDESGAWSIPVESLLAAGLSLHAPSPPTPPPAAAVVVDPVDALRAEMESWRRRAEVAEAVAVERAAALDDVRAALAMAQRLLTTGDTPTPGVAPPAAAAPVAPRARWWKR